ncbi:hypothetical protein EZV62_020286 [Acer yangbiense]|uniref:RNase H type-1 domain-containing protein n=1 Tax=Acer yangbiense TaxID=1000413 RepID=A0A5C7HDG5_9ROSI|nr:hypothetical protein EZV62_020286 [Acer yangbiense]
MPPESENFKLNVDAAIDKDRGRVGIGLIIRDCNGEVLASCAQRIDDFCTPMVAEAVAILRGLMFAREVGIWPQVVESDAKAVVDLVNCDGLICSDMDADRAAHSIAKLGLHVVSDCVWLQECPPCVTPIVLGDCPPLM